MFESLADRLSKTLRTVTGQARLNENNIADTLREVRRALLEADVALEVVKAFVERVRSRALGQEVIKSLSPGQQFVKIVQQELELIMGSENAELDLRYPPTVILMAGLQGAGKTTSVAKLARLLQERQKKKVLVVSTDIYRPAAIAQLEKLAADVEVEFFPSTAEQTPNAIAQAALKYAQIHYSDVLLVDTAGRLHIDDAMMSEIQALHTALNPQETLFVVDAMTGQDAARTAKAFGEALPLTGIILTKADGDARGGAALSVRYLTDKPIKFIGMGEKTDALEPFHPQRIASRILGMGDVLSLIEAAERHVDKIAAERLSKKIKKGQGFDLEDFREQLGQVKKMGGMGGLLDKLPGMGRMTELAQSPETEKMFGKMEAMINSMTLLERYKPEIINGSRKRRICMGSGTQVPELNRLLKQHKQMQKMMKKMGKQGNRQKMMQSMDAMMNLKNGQNTSGMSNFFRR